MRQTSIIWDANRESRFQNKMVVDSVLRKGHEAEHNLDKDICHNCIMLSKKCRHNSTINAFTCNKDPTEQSDPNIGNEWSRKIRKIIVILIIGVADVAFISFATCFVISCFRPKLTREGDYELLEKCNQCAVDIGSNHNKLKSVHQ
ncbi:uncharacterized protein LOC130732673 [Lotus japonicus]|uniref:uncharacterized protein LOC130732673 n=1 Tax=Lotus japonicus TaxID=34305 RepID=UPI00258883BF|nr:uncharacterized protein LOC130732673 [Lotus japonicus]